MIKNSRIYSGQVIHTRFKPKKHNFKYKVFSLLIDLDEIDKINNNLNFFSYNRFNLISFFDKDHGNRDGSDVKQWVKENLIKKNIKFNNFRVEILCYPRILGYVFNPLSILYVYNESNELISIFYEVKNTFGEQHTYVFKAKNNNLLQHNCSKKFHVSPFIEMNCNYFFRILRPSEKISVVIDQYQFNEKILFASQDGKRVDFNSKELLKSYLKHPLMTFKIISAIHFEAFKLWIKGIKFIKKKFKIKNNISFEN